VTPAGHTDIQQQAGVERNPERCGERAVGELQPQWPTTTSNNTNNAMEYAHTHTHNTSLNTMHCNSRVTRTSTASRSFSKKAGDDAARSTAAASTNGPCSSVFEERCSARWSEPCDDGDDILKARRLSELGLSRVDAEQTTKRKNTNTKPRAESMGG